MISSSASADPDITVEDGPFSAATAIWSPHGAMSRVTVSTDEASVLVGNVFANNGSGVDTDVDGPALSVSAVNGSGVGVGSQIALASGALLTLNANGTFSYDPNHAFDATPAASSGAPGSMRCTRRPASRP